MMQLSCKHLLSGKIIALHTPYAKYLHDGAQVENNPFEHEKRVWSRALRTFLWHANTVFVTTVYMLRLSIAKHVPRMVQ